MTPQIGSLCSGYGGLDLAVLAVLGGEVVWHAETDWSASAVLERHWPAAPNHGDITTMDWSAAGPVDVLTAGWPCQPWSSAGKRKGVEDERAIWPEVARAVRDLRPRLVVLENVSRVVAAGELQRAVADLASLGYVGSWRCLRAAEVGAPHRRERVFVVAADAESHGRREGRPKSARKLRGSDAAGGRASAPPHPAGAGRRRVEPQPVVEHGGAPVRAGQAESGRRRGAPPAHADRTGRIGARVSGTELRGADGPPAGRDDLQHGAVANPDLERREVVGRAHGRQPDAERRSDAAPADSGGGGRARLSVEWGAYEPAIRRWEFILGRPAPAPTVAGRRGARQLSPWLVEWMMGLREGWVCDTNGLSRNDMLRLLGNGVIPQQGAAGVRWLLGTETLAGVA